MFNIGANIIMLRWKCHPDVVLDMQILLFGYQPGTNSSISSIKEGKPGLDIQILVFKCQPENYSTSSMKDGKPGRRLLMFFVI